MDRVFPAFLEIEHITALQLHERQCLMMMSVMLLKDLQGELYIASHNYSRDLKENQAVILKVEMNQRVYRSLLRSVSHARMCPLNQVSILEKPQSLLQEFVKYRKLSSCNANPVSLHFIQNISKFLSKIIGVTDAECNHITLPIGKCLTFPCIILTAIMTSHFDIIQS